MVETDRRTLVYRRHWHFWLLLFSDWHVGQRTPIQTTGGIYEQTTEITTLGPGDYVGEMSLVSTMLNTMDNLGAIDSRNADVYCEEDLRILAFNYSPVVEILQDDNRDFKRFRHQILI